MKRRKRFNVRDKQHRRYNRYLAALARRSPASDAPFTRGVPPFAPAYDRHALIMARRFGHAAGRRFRRTGEIPW